MTNGRASCVTKSAVVRFVSLDDIIDAVVTAKTQNHNTTVGPFILWNLLSIESRCRCFDVTNLSFPCLFVNWVRRQQIGFSSHLKTKLDNRFVAL